jgi:hypothetical protein
VHHGFVHHGFVDHGFADNDGVQPAMTAPDDPADATPAPPLLRIVRGNPTPEETAAIVALLTSMSGGQSPPPAPPVRGRWNDPVHNLRQQLRPGPGAWRAAH